MEITYLIDTNVFLEILLAQEKRNICKEFLINNAHNIGVSDFSYHSIGVILFRNNKEELFQNFSRDIISQTPILSLPFELYPQLALSKQQLRLDFDDSYQFHIATNFNLTIAMDSDFRRVEEEIPVLFL